MMPSMISGSKALFSVLVSCCYHISECLCIALKNVHFNVISIANKCILIQKCIFLFSISTSKYYKMKQHSTWVQPTQPAFIQTVPPGCKDAVRREIGSPGCGTATQLG